MTFPTAPPAVAAFDGPRGWWQGLRYGFMGFPLAFVALPLYVSWPNHWARAFGVSLATLGSLLLAVRLLDAVVDPLIGRWVDRLAGHGAVREKAFHRFSALTCVLLVMGFWALFFPPVTLRSGSETGLLVWAAGALVLTCLAFSALTVAHHAWGARYGGNAAQRSRVVGWREGLGLAGVVVASVVPTVAGLEALVAVMATTVVLGWWLWRQSVPPGPGPAPGGLAPRPAAEAPGHDTPALWAPLRQPGFRRLLAVFVVNGMASAVPATLVLFFVQDRLQAPAALEPLFLGSYFVCAAAAIPLWLRVVARVGLARAWWLGMGLSVLVFAWVLWLGQGDWWMFALVCALSGVALGADLVLPGALLNGLIADQGHRHRSEGAYMGWWSFASKLNLAIAAGLALPLLGALGYAPGRQDESALWALTLVYGLVPCVLKLVAAVLLHVFFLRKGPP